MSLLDFGFVMDESFTLMTVLSRPFSLYLYFVPLKCLLNGKRKKSQQSIEPLLFAFCCVNFPFLFSHLSLPYLLPFPSLPSTSELWPRHSASVCIKMQCSPYCNTLSSHLYLPPLSSRTLISRNVRQKRQCSPNCNTSLYLTFPFPSTSQLWYVNFLQRTSKKKPLLALLQHLFLLSFPLSPSTFQLLVFQFLAASVNANINATSFPKLLTAYRDIMN